MFIAIATLCITGWCLPPVTAAVTFISKEDCAVFIGEEKKRLPFYVELKVWECKLYEE